MNLLSEQQSGVNPCFSIQIKSSPGGFDLILNQLPFEDLIKACFIFVCSLHSAENTISSGRHANGARLSSPSVILFILSAAGQARLGLIHSAAVQYLCRDWTGLLHPCMFFLSLDKNECESDHEAITKLGIQYCQKKSRPIQPANFANL